MKKHRIVNRLLIVLIIVLILIFTGTLFYRFYDHLSWTNAFYFTIMTVLTVGFGDISPKDPTSKIFTMIFAVVSIPTILFCLGYIVEEIIRGRINRLENKVDEVIQEEKEIIKEENKILAEEGKILKKKK